MIDSEILLTGEEMASQSRSPEHSLARRLITAVFPDAAVSFDEGDGLEVIGVDSRFTLHRSVGTLPWELCAWRRPSREFVVLGHFVSFAQALRRLVVLMAVRRMEEACQGVADEAAAKLGSEVGL